VEHKMVGMQPRDFGVLGTSKQPHSKLRRSR